MWGGQVGDVDEEECRAIDLNFGWRGDIDCIQMAFVTQMIYAYDVPHWDM
jgi:hypothetical protein